MKKLCLILATGFGTGLAPVASGTFGTLPGVALVWALYSLSLGWQIVIAAALTLASIPICEVAERCFVEKDDGRIVADEYLTFPICLLGIPWMDGGPGLRSVGFLGVAFVVSRVMDIVKPPPARRLQDLHGGVGIVVDDVIANLYALAANWAIWLTMNRVLGSV